MELNLIGRTVAVLGAAKGIGRAIAEGFLKEDCRVVGFDLEPDAAPLAASGDLHVGDATSYQQVRAFADGCGEVDHVVFAVGAGSGKFGFPFWNLNPNDWTRVLEVNLIAAVNAAHAFAPGMAERGRGSMLFLTSVAGQIGSQTDPPYSAAKAALINFTQCAAKDLAPYAVRVNALSPGMVRTELNESVWAAAQQTPPKEQRVDYATWAAEKTRKVSPLGQMQSPEEIATMAVYLASDHARNITGQTINVDGGQVMHS